MVWYVYMLACQDGSYYTGVSTDVDRRFKEHQMGRGAKYTRSHKPQKVIYREAFSSRSDALKSEWHLKHLSRSQKQDLIKLSS